jgi:hypothetical protein
MATENGLGFIEINSKNYNKVEMAFKQITGSILQKIENGEIPLNQQIGIKTGDQ